MSRDKAIRRSVIGSRNPARKLPGKLLPKLVRNLARKLVQKRRWKLTAELQSKHRTLHRDKLDKPLSAKLADNPAAKFMPSLGSVLGPKLGLNLARFPGSILVQNHRRNLPGGQSLVRTLYGDIVVPAVPDHYI